MADSRQVRLTAITTELLRLREEYEDLQVSAVSQSISTYEQARATRIALDELIAQHEDLVQIHRRWAQSS